MKRIAMIVLSAAALLAAETVKLPRASLEMIERGFDRTLTGIDPDAPFEILGLTRGLYLDGYGVVFTTEANLVIMPVSPFHPKPDKAAIAKLNARKKQRLVLLKDAMRRTLVAAAEKLNAVPAAEQVVLGVNLFYKPYEQRDGLPDQVVMQGTRQALIHEGASSIRVVER